ncbi:MAG: phosphoenolpyruvate carboxylase [Ginsengibacter sp.]
MDNKSSKGLQHFKSLVGLKFQLYNSLFTSLPFHRIEKTGILLSLFLNNCEEGYKKKLSPTEIVESFFEKHTSLTDLNEQLNILFRFIQFVERQVVLFDALEDAAFTEVNDISGAGTLKQLELDVIKSNKELALEEKLKDFSIRLVLTAHPTQFYPGSVLGIINDLAKALIVNNTNVINIYLQQLGKTPFFKKEKPTPYDEAISLIWYLENVFYMSCGKIISFIKDQFPNAVNDLNPIIRMGFWPGGDRDGNPFVKTETTLKVAESLHGAIIKCYYLDIRRLKRRLTFEGVDVILSKLENILYENLFIPGAKTELKSHDLIRDLEEARDILIYKHNSLFLHLLDNLINKINVFGMHFASLDIRQDSRIHTLLIEELSAKGILRNDYNSLNENEKISSLLQLKKLPSEGVEFADNDTLKSINAIKEIQNNNGEWGCNRYIISQCNSALNVFEVYGLCLLSGWTEETMKIDIVPLFETIDDLRNAPKIITFLYNHAEYKKHLERRGNTQTIMLGFSDGTKDGGYLTANWCIYKAKEELTKISKDHNISVVFFDGRGGPPARGGGKTHKFYASMGHHISNKEIQLTIQGQTVSSNFGTVDSAQFNIEQLLNAGISNTLFADKSVTLNKDEEKLITSLSNDSLIEYINLKQHPDFTDYLANISPLKFYNETNISSRPTKKNTTSRFDLKDLRAIPFVGAWSQIKQNVTGYYGFGTALQNADKKGEFNQIKSLYKNSLFFKTLVDNCEMAMKKCFFPLTEYLASDKKYGEIWNMIYNEYVITEKYLLKLNDKTELMEDYPIEQLSISMREKIVLPLVTIQQFAISQIRTLENQQSKDKIKDTYSKLVMRCSFGIINAGRNSA